MAATDPGVARPRANTTLMTWGSLALSGVCIYLALRGTNLKEIGSTLSRAHLWFMLSLLLLQVPFFALKAVRWRMLLAPVRPTPTIPLVAPMMIGFMGNNVLPARLGEFIRMYLGARLLRIAPSQVLATLFLERIFDFIAVLVFFGAGVIVMGDVPSSLVSAGYAATAVSVAGMTGAAAYVIWTRSVLRVAAVITRRLPPRVGSMILEQLELGASGMGALRRPWLLFGIVTTSFLKWLLMAACVYCSLLAVDVNVPWSAAFVILAATVFGAMIPAAPGYIGTIHLAFVLALTPFAVRESSAMAAAVVYHAIPYLGVTLSGLYFLRQTGARLREIERGALES